MATTRHQVHVNAPNMPGESISGKWTKRSVQRRVNDWIGRLNDLYDILGTWIADVPNARVLKGDLKQVPENMMKEVGLAPRDVPTYTVLLGRKRIAFVPSAIWIVGANGRVNVTTNTRQHMLQHTLVDMDGCDGRPSNWQLVDMSKKSMFRPFDRAAFLELLKE